MPRSSVDRVVVVVPAHDEERLIGDALRALRGAADVVAPRVETTVVVVANGCADATAAQARAAGAVVIELPVANVGAARAAGFAWALEQPGPLDRLWVSTTDADSRVSPRWLAAQLSAADAGAELYLGTVALGAADRALFAGWVAGYDSSFESPGPHGHVHGASMGMRARTYARSGGFSALAVGEDVDLVTRVSADGGPIAWDATCPVLTSARLAARAPAGVARDLELSLGVRDEAVWSSGGRRCEGHVAG